MKRYNKVLFGLLLASQVFTSCDKSFLDEKVLASYSPETLTDSLGMEAQIVGLQQQFNPFLCRDDRQGYLAVWQAGTDITMSVQPQGIETPYVTYGLLNSTDEAASWTWSWAYKIINNANVIINNIETGNVGTMGQANKNSLKAEALFYRAYAYNLLATCYGGVPISTTPITTAKTDFVRATLDEVNQLIESDLLYSAQYLPYIDQVKKTTSGKFLYGRPNKAMAQQLLAEAYLRMDKPDKAEAQCDAIISSGKFSLITARYGLKKSQPGDCFSDMFFAGNQRRSQGNTEVIWDIEIENPTDVPGLSQGGNPQQRRVWGAAYHNVTGMVPCDSLGGRGNARMRLNNFVLYHLYGAGDMRNSQYNIKRVFYYNDPTKTATYGKPVPLNTADTLYKVCPYTLKWGHFDSRDAFGYGMWKDMIMMRLAETYLLKAEAQFKQNKLSDAATTINIIRARANATPVSASDISMNFILDERARELLAEENRRMTLLRTKTLLQRVAMANATTPATYQVTGITEKNLLFPIPQSEIDLNKDAKLEQNPNY
ncbi:RagB/SusD family nutrient uptake outer membrane protein [Parabacteroides sp. FAFU027]|uniref:RagB/SusD family nutrient uptake outer membrane protein n=1 Tax=Parabacteroides sp. FAFU027 TaxID=2922715 RepID=UPI001FAFD988|nr:RagB/SusD family nutrient uptake outer membrane protein [Parabacteroides sp. FAFU027]